MANVILSDQFLREVGQRFYAWLSLWGVTREEFLTSHEFVQSLYIELYLSLP